MLAELHIENFAIIERLDIEFIPGLVTFTGETGAGKSIIIDAVETLLGGRAEAIQIRSGAERAVIEAVFQLSESSRPAIQTILEREDLLDEPETLNLAREIRQNGRNVARINGRSVSTGLLREISEYLIDVHGQSDHLSLLRVGQHLNLLDRFAAAQAGEQLTQALEGYTATYRRLQEVKRQLDEIRLAEADAARQTDILSFQIREIEAASLRPGEEEDLREERNRLANAESLSNFTQQALVALDEGTPESPAATDLLGSVTEAIENLARLDPAQSALFDTSQSIFDGLAELSHNLRLYLENIEFNPKRLDFIEERLALIQSLKRKYGATIPAALEFLEKIRQQLDQITHAEARLQELESEQERLLAQLGAAGLALSVQRQETAARLEQGIERELADLQMSGARFKVDLQTQPDPAGASLPDGRRLKTFPNGLDKVEFLIAPNPGEGFKPLAKIASGGETSRLMLALKNVLTKADHIPTLIFDEIDQGIGGRVGAVVGQKLWQLGRQHQVLCITHLPQLAAYGDQHYHVEKKVQDGRTLTVLKALARDERLVELAQMLGSVSAGTLQSARELIQAAESQLSLN